MPRAFTLADKMHDRPAEIREVHPLFDYVREQAEAVKALDAKVVAARKKHDATIEVLHETIEFQDLTEAKERVAAARRTALDDPAVAKAKQELAEAKQELAEAKKALKRSAKDLIAAEKKAKGNLKALVEVLAETERGIVSALKAGRVPSPLIRDDATATTE